MSILDDIKAKQEEIQRLKDEQIRVVGDKEKQLASLKDQERKALDDEEQQIKTELANIQKQRDELNRGS